MTFANLKRLPHPVLRRLLRSRRSAVAVMGLGILFSLTANTAIAQIGSAKKFQAKTELVPQSAFAAIVVFPKQLVNDPMFAAFPREIVTASVKQEMGFDPMLIEQAVLVMAPPKVGEVFDQPPPWALVLYFDQMQGLSGNVIEQMAEKSIGGKRVFLDEGNPIAPAFMIFDESTLVVGNPDYLQKLIAEPKGELAAMIQRKEVEGDGLLFVDIKAIRAQVNEMIGQMPSLPPPMEALKQLPGMVDSISIGHRAMPTMETRVVMRATDPANAEKLKQIITEALEFGHQALLAEMASQMDLNDPVQMATVQYVERIWKKYEPRLTPQINDRVLTWTLHEEVLAIPFMAGFLGQSVTQTIDPSTNTTNELRQTALAALNYESAYGKMPPAVIKDDQGRPLFSGRVAMLPFIEQVSLYNSLRMDEPWDSEHNAPLVAVQIDTYGDLNGTGMIRYPVFPGSLWDGDQKSIGQIIDGTSNTILAIQAPPGDDRNWADPTPWKISESNPMADVFGDRDRVMVVFVDGHVETLVRNDMSNEKLKALLTIGGGEVVR